MTRCSLAVEPLVPPPIDTAFAFSHDASCEPPAAVAGAKVENRFLVFQARQRVFCTGRSGGESAQSSSRPSLRRPWGTPSCSRCERSPDTASGCAASSRAVPPTCVPLPPWRPPSPCDGNGVDTSCATLHPGEPPSALLPPAACAENIALFADGSQPLSSARAVLAGCPILSTSR